ncbi:MAG: hypothetical protein R3211_12015, partial [Balneolaceae bacterium]|nr:hypothetical protein [Balneolaceae bacterium]
WPNAGVDRNRLLVGPNPRWKPGIDYEIRVWNPFFEDYRSIKPTIWHPRDLGALNITLTDTTDTRKHRLRVVSAVRGVIADTLFSRSVEVESIPPLNYKLIVFYDANGNGMWDHGTVDPFRPPEPYFIQTNVPVEKRFTSDVTIDL